jgi:hypothetical protein
LPAFGKTPIYHPHGFLPFGKRVSTENSTGKIILSEDDYNSVANSGNYWANLIQTSNLTQGTGLMIGLSFNDRNLRRLIDLIANLPLHTNNYIFLKRNSQPEISEADALSIKERADSIFDKMRKAGIKMNHAAYNNSQQILKELFNKDEEITRLVFDKMRIKPIWFSEYEEVERFVGLIAQ